MKAPGGLELYERIAAEAAALYEAGLTHREIGERLNVSQRTAGRACHHGGAVTRKRGSWNPEWLDPHAVEATVALYRSGLSTSEVARKIGRGESSVRHRLAVAGEPMRSRSQALRLMHARERGETIPASALQANPADAPPPKSRRQFLEPKGFLDWAVANGYSSRELTDNAADERAVRRILCGEQKVVSIELADRIATAKELVLEDIWPDVGDALVRGHRIWGDARRASLVKARKAQEAAREAFSAPIASVAA